MTNGLIYLIYKDKHGTDMALESILFHADMGPNQALGTEIIDNFENHALTNVSAFNNFIDDMYLDGLSEFKDEDKRDDDELSYYCTPEYIDTVKHTIYTEKHNCIDYSYIINETDNDYTIDYVTQEFVNGKPVLERKTAILKPEQIAVINFSNLLCTYSKVSEKDIKDVTKCTFYWLNENTIFSTDHNNYTLTVPQNRTHWIKYCPICGKKIKYRKLNKNNEK